MLMFHGQKPTIYGQNGVEAVFTVCYDQSRQSKHCDKASIVIKQELWQCMHCSYLYTNLNGGKLMRHFYFRLIFGIVWLAVAVVSVVNDNISFVALYVVLGIVFLWSAYSSRKKEKDNDQKHNG